MRTAPIGRLPSAVRCNEECKGRGFAPEPCKQLNRSPPVFSNEHRQGQSSTWWTLDRAEREGANPMRLRWII
jgi:hypothetical protein